MKVICILSIIFWEYHIRTNANVQEKAGMMMDMPDGCFGEDCVSSHTDVKREITKENETQTKLFEKQPLISSRRSESVVTRSRDNEKLETADYFKEEIVPIKRHKRFAFWNRRKASKVRTVAIKAMIMKIESTKLMKEILNGSVVHLNSLLGEACNSIKQESKNILEKITSFASETKTNIKEAHRNGRLLKAQALAATNVDEVIKLSFINTVKLPSIYFPSVESIINLIESNAIKTLKTSTSLGNKMDKLETTNEGLRNFISTQTQKISDVARKCASKFTEIGQLAISKLKVYSDNTDKLFTELADNYGKKFSAMGKENNAQEVNSRDASSELIQQIKRSDKEKHDGVFSSISGQLHSLVSEVKEDIKEIVKNKFKLGELI